jgi:hypothetical protein
MKMFFPDSFDSSRTLTHFDLFPVDFSHSPANRQALYHLKQSPHTYVKTLEEFRRFWRWRGAECVRGESSRRSKFFLLFSSLSSVSTVNLSSAYETTTIMFRTAIVALALCAAVAVAAPVKAAPSFCHGLSESSGIDLSTSAFSSFSLPSLYFSAVSLLH